MGGTEWAEVLNAQDFLDTSEKVYVRWLSVAPSNANVVYALASIQYYEHGTLLKSVDGGDTWAKFDSVVDGRGACLAVDPYDSEKLYVGSWYRGVYRSTDGGSTWQAINNGLPTIYTAFRSIAIDPTDTQRVYVGVGGQVYQSSDGGDSWSRLGGTLSTEGEVRRIVIDPANPETIYAAVYVEGVYELVRLAYLPIARKDVR